MRIVKAEATGVLDSNASRLEEQIGRCQAEIDKFSRMALVGFSGVASDALVSRIRGQVPVLYAQKAFYSSLKEAERSNSSAVAGLPETSPGVLDTDVAQQRIDEARESVDSLRREQSEALRSASLIELVCPIRLGAIYSYYDSLIEAQNSRITHYELVLRRFEEYEAEAQGYYDSVDRRQLGVSDEAVGRYNQTGSWGLTGLEAYLSPLVPQELPYALGGFVVNAFTNPKQELFHGSISPQELSLGDGVASGKLSGGFRNVTVRAGTSGKFKHTFGKDGKPKCDESAYIEAELSGAHGHGEMRAGRGSAEADVKVGSASAKGELGGGIFDEDGKVNPNLLAKASASVSFLEASGKASYGSEENNVHAKAEGKVLTADLSAQASVGADGISAKAKAETYAVKGSVSGGVTLMGIKVDVKVEGDAGGAGFKGGGEVTRHSANFEIGAGLGLGAGVSVNVDWSGFPGALGDFAIKAWNSVFH